MIRALVTGAAGQLGRDVVASWSQAGHEVLGVDRSGLDVTDRARVHEFVAEARPDVVVNCAAFTAVDACETRADEAFAANEHAVRWLAEACDAIGARLVHISTDYVFDGTKDSPYAESDRPNPQSVYGASKAAGEAAALELAEHATVVRTSWVCGPHGSNMVHTVRRLVAAEQPLAFVDDQIGQPTFTFDLAPALLRLVEDRHHGIFHLTNTGVVSWHGFVREILVALGRDPDLVRSISTAELVPPRPARRPANGVLDNAAWRAVGHAPLRDFREPLREMLGR